MAYTVGTVSDTSDLDVDWPENLGFSLEQIWIRIGLGSQPIQVAALTDQPDALLLSMEWSDGDAALDIWFRVPYVNKATDHKGIRIMPHGLVTPLSRQSGPHREGATIPAGTIGETAYFIRRNLNGTGRVFSRDPGGQETVICEGAYHQYTVEVRPDRFMILARGEYGTFGQETYIYFHEP